MKPYLPVINAFIEDTCVLMVIAYLLARGRTLTLLIVESARPRRALILGVILGLVGLTEAIFPGLRSPYVLHTLIITFAALIGGLRVAVVSILTVLAGVAVLGTSPGVLETALTLTASALLADMVRLLFRARYSLLRGLTAGVCAQSGVTALHQIPFAGFHASHALPHALVAICANGFGVLLLQLLLNDARMRADSAQNRLEAERAHALAREAQLAALRARIHPHFLFNALTSIAALCSLSPDKAESSVLRLSQLMRRALEFNTSAPLCLSEEIEYTRGYLEIESHRFGSRLQILWQIDPAAAHVQIPVFALQTLVENAVGHGIAPKMGTGRIRIVARARPRHVLIAVQDDGVGMTRRLETKTKRQQTASAQYRPEPAQAPHRNSPAGEAENAQSGQAGGENRAHGLEIVNAQLTLLYGARARLRVFSREDQGTLAAFAVPLPIAAPPCLHAGTPAIAQADAQDADSEKDTRQSSAKNNQEQGRKEGRESHDADSPDCRR